MENIVISDSKNLQELKDLIDRGGLVKFHVLADFDRTLTYDSDFPSLISILRDQNYLTSDYPAKATALFEKYHPMEIDPDLNPQNKKVAMEEWWRTHFELLIKSGLSKDDLNKVLKTDLVKFRDGVLEFLDFLHDHNIPLVIMSASGLGEEIISMALDKVSKNYDNIHIVSNSFEWDEDGKAVAVKEPIIHSANKDETLLHHLPFYEEIAHRPNVLLLGDNLEDIDMAKGFDHNVLLKIGFLNKDAEKNLLKYQENFDIIITDNGDFSFINDLIVELFPYREGRETEKIK